MKRTAMILVVLIAAVSLYAGGKECNLKTSGKSVELTGTIARADGDHARSVFHVANSDQSYTVCEKTKASLLKLGADGNTTLRVKGKIVSCGEGEELLIEQASKI